MLWKSVFLAFLVVGALAELPLTDEQREQLKAVLTQYCKKNGAEDKAAEAENAAKNFLECLRSVIDPAQIQKEIEEAKPKGALDEVFKKYCARSPELKSCIQNVTTAMSPCLDEKLRQYIPHFNNGTSQLLNFVCHKDGDRIALFIAEGGPDCIKEKANAIRDCMTSSTGFNFNQQMEGVPNLREACAKVDVLTQCVVTALEGCSTPTPGNMAEALFKFIKLRSPCKDFTDEKKKE